MIIQDAEFHDLPEILLLQKLCYQENAERYNDYLIAPLQQTIEELEKEFTHNTILKAVADARIVGSIRAYEKNNVCCIGRVIVHPQYQNQGIGKNMMLDIEKRYPDVLKYELFTGFRDTKNLFFYQKLGYKISKEEAHGKDMTFIFLEKIKSDSNRIS